MFLNHQRGLLCKTSTL